MIESPRHPLVLNMELPAFTGVIINIIQLLLSCSLCQLKNSKNGGHWKNMPEHRNAYKGTMQCIVLWADELTGNTRNAICQAARSLE